MFSRRRAHSNPPPKTPPTAAALTAAGQAFLANRVSNANLSNAAAAAALRSQTTSPTPVAEIQTKRMIQRRGSASSNGSARSGLQRRDSGGSMTERSFRDPSPSRNTSSDYRYDDAPPVPALPKGYMSPPPLPHKSNRRAASVERPPERVLSPPPSTNGRGVSLDRGPGIMPSQLRARTQARSIEPGSAGQADRARNRESVNFSRPMSSAMSPPTSPVNDQRLASPSPKVSNQPSSANAPNVGRLRDGEVENIQYNLNKTAQAPVKKKKKSVAKHTEGSYLASGVSGGRAAGTMVQSTPRRQQDSTQSTPSPVASSSHPTNAEEIPRPLPKKKKKKAARSPGSQGGDLAYGSYLSDSDSAVSDRSNATDRSRTYNTRAAGLLAKQPSIVREDREAEEEEDFRNPFTNLGKSTQNGSAVRGTDNEQPKTFTSDKRSTPIHTKKSSLDIPSTELVPTCQNGTSSNPPVRQQSLSPARAAHFSAQPILETPDNLKHQPPARSISPVKSALKHSPSRGPSPVAGISLVGSNRRGPASEASDTTSMISDDGSKSGPKQKKHARVSFDSESVVVGRAATPPTDPDSPMIMSPQNKEASTRRWLGLGKDQDQRPLKYSKGDDTAIKPTPVLPSFGSVRERNERAPTAESDWNTTEPTTTALKSGATSDQRGKSILSPVLGSDEAGIVTQEPELNASNDPLPPEVTSVEGTGYQSDTDNSVTSDHVQDSQLAEAEPASTVAQQDPHAHPVSNTGVASADVSPLAPSISNEVPSISVQPATPALGDTPSIAIQPATPGLDEYRKGWDQYSFDMPGGFPTLTDDSVDDRPASSTNVENRSPDITPATVGISEPVPEAVVTSHYAETSVTGDAVEGLRIQTEPDSSEESDHTNNSIYSDAAEDLSDLEGDGFGSINAIVESPASPPLGTGRTKQPESPTGSKTKPTSLRSIPLNRNESELSEPGSEAGWDKAQAYWSGLSESRKQQIERAAAQGDILDSSAKPGSKPKKKKIVPKKPTQEVPQFNPDREDEGGSARPSSNTRGSKAKAKASAMKSSMRDNASESHPKTRMQSSMRGSVPAKPSIRASLPPEPTAAVRGALQTKTRPLSAVGSEIYKPQAREVASGHDRSASLGNFPNLAAKAKPKSPQPVRRMMSNDSDSSSSFKKARSKSSDTGRYTMKRSMRGSSVDEGPGHSRASSMTTRTSLPADTARRPFSSVGPSMRSSMRDSIDSSKSTRTKSPSRFSGFGKSSKPKAAAKGPTSRFSSRFADSSDEEDGPINRRSRFADSSDEDEPTGLTPVRGIPRRIDEGDSTDLEDSSADEKPSTKATKSPAQQPTRLEGTALGAGSLRTIHEGSGSPTALMGTGLMGKRAGEKEKKKRSFFGGLGSKKVPKSEPFTQPAEGREPQQDGISAKPGRPLGQTPQDAPASPRSPKEQRLLVPGSPDTVDTEASTVPGKIPKSPKLQRRISAQQAEKIQLKRGVSDSWPLPQSPGGTSTPTMRPTTSEGTPKAKNGTIGLSSLNKELRLDRPGLGDRQNTVETTATGGTGTVKKKKGWFKKAFGR